MRLAGKGTRNGEAGVGPWCQGGEGPLGDSSNRTAPFLYVRGRSLVLDGLLEVGLLLLLLSQARLLGAQPLWGTGAGAEARAQQEARE